MVNSKEFGNRIQKIMDHYGISASSFADTMGVGRSSISHILSGRNKPSLDFVMKIIDAYPEVELYWLLNGVGTFPYKKSNNSTNKKKYDEDFSPLTILSSSDSLEPDLFSNYNSDTKTNESSTDENKINSYPSNTDIDRIIIFYTNGTFDSYFPKKK